MPEYAQNWNVLLNDLKYEIWKKISEFYNVQEVFMKANFAENFQVCIVYQRLAESFLPGWYIKKGLKMY